VINDYKNVVPNVRPMVEGRGWLGKSYSTWGLVTLQNLVALRRSSNYMTLCWGL